VTVGEHGLKVLILGVGSQGSVIATHLARSPEVTEIRLADINFRKVKNLAKRLGSDKVATHKVNARKLERVVNVAKKADIIVNAASYSWDLIENSMKASLKVGANYIDLAGVRQLIFDRDFKDSSLTAIIGMGEDPGISNLLAARASDKLDRIDEIRIKDWGSVRSKEMVSSWSPAAAWADLAAEPIIYDKGKFKLVPPFSGEEVYHFPAPIGPQKVTWHAHEEVVTIPHFFKNVDYVDFKLGIPDLAIAKYVIQLGLMSEEYITVRGRRIHPRDVFVTLLPRTLSMDEVESKMADGTLMEEQEYIVLEAVGDKAGRRIKYNGSVLMTLQEVSKLMSGATALSYLVGTPAAIGVEMFCRKEIETSGVLAPEGLKKKERDALLRYLVKKGIKIREETQDLYKFRIGSLEKILMEEEI